MSSSGENHINSLKTLANFLQKQNNWKNVTYMSSIPEVCKTEPCILGVDEAGRGPVLGPMVYGIAFCPITQKEILKTLGCADSKQLTEEKRDEIFEELNTKDYATTNLGWSVEVISPNDISMSMLRRTKRSLNEVSMDSAIGLIHKAIEGGVNVAEIYVDTVGPPEKYQAKLKDIFPDCHITVAKKADSTYPIVSAASICAKVTRDHALKVWQFRERLQFTCDQFGSGYPGDPKTKSFLQDTMDPVFGYSRLVRFSWQTASNALNGKAYEMEFEENEEERPKGYGAIKNFFKSDDEKLERHKFFKDRFLENIVDL